jgi:hypothetical protein
VCVLGLKGRNRHSSVVLSNGSILVMGGEAGTENYSFLVSNEVWKSSDGGATWTLLTDNAWGTNNGKNEYF